MTRRLKPVEIGLDTEIQQAVLSLPLEAAGSLTTIGNLVKRASEDLQLANRAIQENALIKMTAESIMKREKRRGIPSILVQLDGTVYLQIVYEGDDTEIQRLPLPESKIKKLPSLTELRDQAEEMGLDVSDLGRQKRKIMERLSASRSNGKGDHSVTPPPTSLRDEVKETTLPRSR